VIILCADATPAAQQESLDAGANEFLTKPVQGSGLLATIERVMAGAENRHTITSGEKTIPVQMPRSGERAAPTAYQQQVSPPVLVDPDRIESLRRIANRDRTFLQRYTAATLDDLDAAVAELGRAVADGNLKGARDALHKIDGTSASIGAMALAASAKSMRNYLSSSPDPDTAAALAELVSTSALTKSAVTALLQDGRISHRDSR